LRSFGCGLLCPSAFLSPSICQMNDLRGRILGLRFFGIIGDHITTTYFGLVPHRGNLKSRKKNKDTNHWKKLNWSTHSKFYHTYFWVFTYFWTLIQRTLFRPISLFTFYAVFYFLQSF
jgi:hypothetical protein